MKVFVTVGTQLPFDRLVRAVDAWAATRGDVEVFAQVGPSRYPAGHIRSEPFVDPLEFERLTREADLLVAHAGTGSIFAALELRKPIIVMPRRARLGEHRNDHQVATVDKFRELVGIHVADDEHEVRRLLDRAGSLARPLGLPSAQGEPSLLSAVSDFINDGAPAGSERARRMLRFT